MPDRSCSAIARPALLALVLVAGASLPLGAATQSKLDPPEVFVLATLYHRHDSTRAYGHATLRRLIQEIRPAVVVLDVSPGELRERQVHPSKREYPDVIFPLLDEHGLIAYAGEPDEPMFSTIVQELGEALRAFRTEHADAAAADAAFERATFQALAQLWRTPADVNSAVTDQLLAARRAYQDQLAGPDVAEAWRVWNEHTVDVVRRAQREHPGSRILVLVGIANAGPVRAGLEGEPRLKLVDMEDWIRASPAAGG